MNVKQYRISLFVAAILIIIVCIFAVYYAVNQKNRQPHLLKEASISIC